MVRMLQFSKYLFMSLAAMFLAVARVRPGRRQRPPARLQRRSPSASAWASPPVSAVSARAAPPPPPPKRSPATPAPAPASQLFLILGLAFIESLTLFTFVLLFVRTASTSGDLQLTAKEPPSRRLFRCLFAPAGAPSSQEFVSCVRA